MKFWLWYKSPLHRRNDFETATFSKVITQSRSLFYDERAGDRLIEEVTAIEEADIGSTEAP